MTDGTATDIDALAGWLEILKVARAERARAEEVIATARGHIEQALGDNEIGMVAGTPVVTWAWSETTRLDQGKAKAALTGEQLTACMVTTRSRTFNVVKASA